MLGLCGLGTLPPTWWQATPVLLALPERCQVISRPWPAVVVPPLPPVPAELSR
jgi:hypothetical protein